MHLAQGASQPNPSCTGLPSWMVQLQARAPTPGTWGCNAFPQLPKPHTNPQGLTAGALWSHQQPPPRVPRANVQGEQTCSAPAPACPLWTQRSYSFPSCLRVLQLQEIGQPLSPFPLGFTLGLQPCQHCAVQSSSPSLLPRVADGPPKSLVPFPWLLRVQCGRCQEHIHIRCPCFLVPHCPSALS